MAKKGDHNMLLGNAKYFELIRPWAQAALLCVFVAWGFQLRCYNHDDVFIKGNIYFVDGDCYSRMERVRMILDHPFTVVRHQDFENYPQGINSHATAPFDYLIAFLAVLLKPLSALKLFKYDDVDLAGALVSPLLGVAMIVFAWDWARRLKLPFSELVLVLLTVSPILIHGTVLGRPDHQSLQMLCVVVALGAEWAFSQKPSRGWGIASGAAWGLGLWVSLYEPMVLLAITVLLYLVFDRRKLWAPERRAGGIVFVVMLALMLLIDGLPFSPPDKMLMEYFPRWELNIGELAHAGIFIGPLEWAGYALLAAPVLLALRYREDKRAVAVLVLLLAVWGFTAWQQRWGYFFAIVFAMALPVFFAVLRKWWIVWPVFLASLWPVYVELHTMTDPPEQRIVFLEEQKRDTLALRALAEYLKSSSKDGNGGPHPILAPWWQCPALAYWSGQPTVAGTSHESMPGIVDTARFYLTTDYEVADKIVRARHVDWVIAYDSDRVLSDASILLNEKADANNALAAVLYRKWHSAPPLVKVVTYNQEFKVFKVMPEEAPR